MTSRSSFRWRSADTGLGRTEQVGWLALNAARAFAGEVGQRAGAVAPAALAPGPLDFADPTRRATLQSSPGRLLAVHLTRGVCRLVNEKFDRPVSVLDLGCGSGGFAPFFRTELRRFARYTGVDVAAHPSWTELRARDVKLVEARAEEFVGQLSASDDYTLVYSNSALEHVADDLAVVRGLAAWAAASEVPVVQLHVVPATAALALYRCHGYRVYSSRDVGRIRALIGDTGLVASLGGVRSWTTHLARLPRRDREPVKYARALISACTHDLERAPRLPIMWGVASIPGVAPA